MALNLENFDMTHSIKVSIMPTMWKTPNHVSDVVVVSAISSASPILPRPASPIPPLNLLTNTQKVVGHGKLGSEFIN